jgi:hypothetical protein
MKKALLIPYSFILMNWAAVAALYHFARGRKHVWHSAADGKRQGKLKAA